MSKHIIQHEHRGWISSYSIKGTIGSCGKEHRCWRFKYSKDKNKAAKFGLNLAIRILFVQNNHLSHTIYSIDEVTGD